MANVDPDNVVVAAGLLITFVALLEIYPDWKGESESSNN
jgi:hypothetical protein